MADPRSRRTGEHNAQIVKLMADAAEMRDRIDMLEGRVVRLEEELSSARKSTKSVSIAAAPAAPRPTTKRPSTGGPPPLPQMHPAMPPPSKSGGRKSIVDISEIAELVESIPPPAPRSRR